MYLWILELVEVVHQATKVAGIVVLKQICLCLVCWNLEPDF